MRNIFFQEVASYQLITRIPRSKFLTLIKSFILKSIIRIKTVLVRSLVSWHTCSLKLNQNTALRHFPSSKIGSSIAGSMINFVKFEITLKLNY